MGWGLALGWRTRFWETTLLEGVAGAGDRAGDKRGRVEGERCFLGWRGAEFGLGEGVAGAALGLRRRADKGGRRLRFGGRELEGWPALGPGTGSDREQETGSGAGPGERFARGRERGPRGSGASSRLSRFQAKPRPSAFVPRRLCRSGARTPTKNKPPGSSCRSWFSGLDASRRTRGERASLLKKGPSWRRDLDE